MNFQSNLTAEQCEKRNEIERNLLPLILSTRTRQERDNTNEDDIYRMRHRRLVKTNRLAEFE